MMLLIPLLLLLPLLFFLFFFIFKALTLSGARADDHLWPSCWDCIGFLRGTQQFFFFFLIFGVVFFLSSLVSFQFSLKTLATLPLEKKKKSRDPTFNHL
jgi:hypothetical protein